MGALGSKFLRTPPGPIFSPPSKDTSDCTLETSSDEDMPPKKTPQKTPQKKSTDKKTAGGVKKKPIAQIKGKVKKVSFKRGRPASKNEKDTKPRRKKSKKNVVKRLNFNKIPSYYGCKLNLLYNARS